MIMQNIKLKQLSLDMGKTEGRLLAISRVRNISSAYHWNDAIVYIMQCLYFGLMH